MSGRGQGRGRGRGRGRGGRGGGRGRSGSRGRGGGRSAGGRGRGRGGRVWGRGGRSTAWGSPTASNGWDDDVSKQPEQSDDTLDITKDVRKFFVGTADFDKHYDAQQENKTRYVAGMAVLEKNGVEISQNAKIRALAAAWSRNDHELANSLLLNREKFGLVEVLKALTLLDSARRVRVHEKKLKRLQMQAPGGKIKPTVMGKFKSNIDNLNANKPKHGSASGAICRHIKRWVRQFSQKELEFYALHFPAEPWKQLADICHFNPKKDFPNLPWFMSFCFGEPAPEGSMVKHCKEVDADNVNELLKEFPIPYSHIKALHSALSEQSKTKIATNDTLDKILWYYEELHCKDVDEVIKERLDQGEQVSLPYGKLMERLLTVKMLRENITFKRNYSWGNKADEIHRNIDSSKAPFYQDLISLAQKKLHDISLPLEQPIVVIGDRSGSMDVAIRTATIIASLLTAITSAKLVFFDHQNMDAPFVPADIEGVLEMAVTIRTGGSTIPAASLMPFYKKKEVVKTFVVVTDEGENGQVDGCYFDDLFKKYKEEVYNSKLVFVSFVSQTDPGQMVPKLKAIGANVMQFKFDPSRPDLTKLDCLFGLLSSEHQETFEEELAKMETDLKAQGVHRFFEQMVIDGEDEERATKGEKQGPKSEEEISKVTDGKRSPESGARSDAAQVAEAASSTK